jgi:hypothetical protein
LIVRVHAEAFAMGGPTVPLQVKYGMSAEALIGACRALLGPK